MNKIKCIKTTIVSLLLLGSISGISAKVSDLARVSKDTYVTSEHGDNYFADTYYGTVSVKGKDRFFNGTYTAYPTFSRITYDVQGTTYQKQVNSTGKTDATVRTGKITVKDKWNIGSKTKVYGNIGAGFYSNAMPSRTKKSCILKHANLIKSHFFIKAF